MKKYLFIMLLFASSIYGSTPSKMFGVTVGMSFSKARVIFRTKFKQISFEKSVAMYKGRAFGDPAYFMLTGYRGRVVIVSLIIFTGNDSIRKFNSVRDIIKNKYGEPTTETRYYIKPYFSGDGFELQAIGMGKARICDIWKDKKSTASLSITRKLAIVLMYIHNGLSKKLNAEKDKKIKENI